jgi:hypothetical protein
MTSKRLLKDLQERLRTGVQQMPSRIEQEDEWNDDSDDHDTAPTVACPYCRRSIHEESERCPYCGNYISAEEDSANRKPWWIVIGVLICLFLVYRWIAR